MVELDQNIVNIMYICKTKALPFYGGGHLSDVPKFDSLILAVGDQITPITTAINTCNPI